MKARVRKRTVPHLVTRTLRQYEHTGMASMIQLRPSAPAPSDGSRTITIQNVQPRLEGEGGSSPTSSRPPIGALRLRGGPRRTRQRVAWDDGVVDNEGAGKKKSKSTYPIESIDDF